MEKYLMHPRHNGMMSQNEAGGAVPY